jgi:hypothetical protein
MRKIKAEIDPNGKLSVEFIGFMGEECTEERERLRKIMVDFGVMLEPEKITKKSARQITLETNATEQKKRELRHTR